MEISLQNLKENLIHTVKQYSQLHKRNKDSNLEKEERDGLKAIIKRVKDEEIVVFETDKSGRFSVDTRNNYNESAMPHVERDQIIDVKEHDDIEKKINAHSVMWVRMLCAGEGTGQEERIRNNMVSHCNPIAPLYTLRKDHKSNIDPVAGPPSRPVCNTKGALAEKMAFLISKIV